VAVSAIALVAIAAVAFSARVGTRIEFKKFQSLEQAGSSEGRAARAADAASILAGRCCDADQMRRAAAMLEPREALLAVDERGAMLAIAGPGSTDLRNVTTRSSDGVLILDAVRERDGRADGITLQFVGRSPARIPIGNGGSAVVHVIPIPGADVELPGAAFLGSVDRRLLGATVTVAVLALGITWAIARRIFRPIGELGRAAHDLAHGNLSRRVETRGSDEVAALAHSFNAMASELERQQMLRRSLVHDVAHELRTPLTALRCRLETMIDGLATDPHQALAGANEEVRHLSRLVDDLQELALAEARELQLSVGDVAIADVARSAAHAAGLIGDPRLRIDVDPAVTARADPMRVRQVLLNLMTNADRHTPEDGTIAVRAFRASDGHVGVQVHNSGSALDASQLERVFDRFYRADAARQRATGGRGLGLAIVRHLVEAQGGRVEAASDASGVTFSFTLPGGPAARS
jgi:signal transduction histidine kinase